MNADQLPVRASDHLRDVFMRDERLMDIIASHSPQLAKLRNSPFRHVMARVTTVEQAAKLCGMSATELVHDFNAALGIADTADVAADTDHDSGHTELPPSGAFPDDAVVVELDVRDDLRNGREPFSRIMAAVGALGPSEVLRVRATFQPVPLLGVMEKRGFANRVEQHGPEDWSVWFHRARAASRVKDVLTTPSAQIAMVATDARADIVLDVRNLEPPEPMVRTLEAVEAMPANHVLLHINARVPQFLLPILRERGFEYELDESRSNEVRVRIWRRVSPMDAS